MITDSTVEAMREISGKLRRYADDVDRMAGYMDEDGDISRAGECLNLLANMNVNLRLDLLATRPIRELSRRVCELERELENI